MSTQITVITATPTALSPFLVPIASSPVLASAARTTVLSPPQDMNITDATAAAGRVHQARAAADAILTCLPCHCCEPVGPPSPPLPSTANTPTAETLSVLALQPTPSAATPAIILPAASPSLIPPTAHAGSQLASEPSFTRVVMRSQAKHCRG
ncbi:hypothetical protein C8R44DRAFT_890770 [Mycena epipterygia]|nr:hypothetical protein C8R44DRAFT_890770 [Mycena epipterygia]